MRRMLLVACTAVSSLAASDYNLLGSRLSFEMPTDWREVRRLDRDSVSFVAFVVPRPGTDTTGAAGNVMVDAALSHRHADLRTYSDAKLAQEAAGPGSPAIVDDKWWDEDSSRTVLSTSRLRGTPYVLWDKFAVRDSIYIDIRIAIPVAFAADSVWEAQYSAALDRLIASFRIGKRPVFTPAPVTARQ